MRLPPAAYAILIGGSIAGALDITYAIRVLQLFHRVSAPVGSCSRSWWSVRIQGLSGWLSHGRSWPALHFFIMYCIAAIYYAVSLRLGLLTRRPVGSGLFYGVVVYAVMNFIVLPLSAYPHRSSRRQLPPPSISSFIWFSSGCPSLWRFAEPPLCRLTRRDRLPLRVRSSRCRVRVYWFGLRGGDAVNQARLRARAGAGGRRGVTLNPAEVCRGAGYLCAGRGVRSDRAVAARQGQASGARSAARIVDAETAREIRDAAIEGIMEWDGHPFPLVIDTDKFTFRFWTSASCGPRACTATTRAVEHARHGRRQAFRVRIDGMRSSCHRSREHSGPNVQSRRVTGAGQGDGGRDGPGVADAGQAVAMPRDGACPRPHAQRFGGRHHVPQYRPGETKVRVSRRTSARSMRCMHYRTERSCNRVILG